MQTQYQWFIWFTCISLAHNASCYLVYVYAILRVKQGCVLAPTLFSMMFSAMLTDAFRSGDIGVDLRYRTDGKLFNLRRLQAKTKVQMTTVRDFLFADDCALNATEQLDMQSSMDRFATACTGFGLTISTKKTGDAPARSWSPLFGAQHHRGR